MKDNAKPDLARRAFLAGAGVTLAVPIFAAPALAQSAPPPRLDVPYVPTPQEVVNRMLEIVQPRDGDFVMDLGCGDGRMLVTAAREYGVPGYGVDINPVRIEEAVANAKAANVHDKVKFEVRNLFDTPIKDATVLTMYLLSSVNLKLRPRILDEMRPGSRVVSHAFHMGDWEPDIHAVVNGRNVYHWVVPAKVEGRWMLTDGDERYELALDQRFQVLSGSASQGEASNRIVGNLRGEEIRLILHTRTQTRTLVGRVDGARMIAADGSSWSATRQGG